ncbi:MAG: oxygen-dependent coproporphyrinogen oxidase [Chitinophagaceae bacterium]|nr:oxygen-dependent coproporphyrinogen oxidase [Chitinophagaceae bacterium]
MSQEKGNKISVRKEWTDYILSLQDTICRGLENEDGGTSFITDEWKRPGDGGGGRTRVISNGHVFEKGGVNTSVVYGKVTDIMRAQLHIDGDEWFAGGISLILHPENPFVPTVHANYRYFELYDDKGEIMDQWFGGGADLTPYYLFREDAIHFHQTIKNACDPFGQELYPRFKKWCDEYFVNKHRHNEARGIGGIFYDYLRTDEERDVKEWMNFSMSNGNAFLNAYLPIVHRRKKTEFNEEQKKWQEIRRGRYVEFNLIYDRGTLFGLKTDGRVESILVSMPPTVRFEYEYHPAEGSRESELETVLKNPVDWI